MLALRAGPRSLSVKDLNEHRWLFYTNSLKYGQSLGAELSHGQDP